MSDQTTIDIPTRYLRAMVTGGDLIADAIHPTALEVLRANRSKLLAVLLDDPLVNPAPNVAATDGVTPEQMLGKLANDLASVVQMLAWVRSRLIVGADPRAVADQIERWILGDTPPPADAPPRPRLELVP